MKQWVYKCPKCGAQVRSVIREDAPTELCVLCCGEEQCVKPELEALDKPVPTPLSKKET